MKALPRFVVNEIVRRSVELPFELSSEFKFKIADNPHELEQAFRLVYESYEPLGYCASNEFKMRATVHHALPTTTTLVAFYRDEIVGTLTIVRDCRLGLPLENVFDVSELRTGGHRVAEITSLVIREDFRRKNGGRILFPLLKLMYEYSTAYFGVRSLVVAIEPKDDAFYRSLLLFDKISDSRVRDYLGAPAICLQLDLKKALNAYQAVYTKRIDHQNLFKFFVDLQLPQISLPPREYYTINDPVVSMDYFRKTFVERLNVANQSRDRRRVEACISNDSLRRNHPRVDVEISGLLRTMGESATPEAMAITLKDVSRSGFRAAIEKPLLPETIYEIEIQVSKNLRSRIRAEIVWINVNNGIGFAITEADKPWDQFINDLYRSSRSATA